MSKVPLIPRNATFLTQMLRHAGLAIFMLFSISATNAYAETTTIPLSKARQSQIESMLTSELQRVVNTQKRIEGQGKYPSVIARFEAKNGGLTLIIDLSKEYVPRNIHYFGAEMEDLTTELANAASELLRGVVQIAGLEFRIGGKEIIDFFPRERRFMPPARKATGTSNATSTVVVAAGHGVYYHYKYRDWRAQRDPSNGITEDFITPGYASELATWLNARNEGTTSFPRSSAVTTHGPSGQPWWKVGARYHLQTTYPQNQEIWHSLPNSLNHLRERDEDIRSRPLFANHIGASTLIHLHTNAADPAASGTRAIYHTGRSADQQLANSVLCYMKELIQAEESYKNYDVASDAEARNNLGENTLASMPSVVVEVGFHTNPSDAAALQDPVFRTAAMKGVEKGYRLNAEDKPCQPFKIISIPDVSGPQGMPISHRVNYEGYPQFAVKAKVEFVTCQSGWTCNNFVRTIPNNTPSPLIYTTTCTVSNPMPAATFRVKTTLIDVDGVTTNAVEHSYTCTPAAPVAPGFVPTDSNSTNIAAG